MHPTPPAIRGRYLDVYGNTIFLIPNTFNLETVQEKKNFSQIPQGAVTKNRAWLFDMGLYYLEDHPS